MNLICGVRFGAICLAIAAVIPARIEAAQPLSVCQVLKNPRVYENKVISVRGRWVGGSGHGHYISDRYNDRPCPGFRRTGLTWPSTIYPADARDIQLIGDRPLPFKQDASALSEFGSIVEKAGLGSGGHVEATFTGLLRRRGDLNIVCDADGACGGTGYGQSGMHPALLILQTVRDVVVK